MKEKGLAPEAIIEIKSKIITMAGAANYDVELTALGKFPTVEEIELIQLSIMARLIDCQSQQEFDKCLEDLHTLKRAFKFMAGEADNIDAANELFQKRDEIVQYIEEMEPHRPKPKIRALIGR